MRISLIAFLVLLLGLIPLTTVSFSVAPEDLEGSGYDLDSSGSGSGSGDWSEQAGEMKKDLSKSKDATILVGSGNTMHGSSVSTFNNKEWPVNDNEEGYIIVESSKSVWDNKDIFAALIAGGVTGMALAASVTSLLIYKWHRKDDGYILGQKSDYHMHNREEVYC